jgi:hypothetical protein
MPQNRETGAGARDGRETSRFIAKKIGAKAISSNSNEFAYQGRRVTIRCAHLRTHYVGVPYRMLDRIDSVIAAFEDKTGEYDLYEMSPASTRGKILTAFLVLSITTLSRPCFLLQPRL